MTFVFPAIKKISNELGGQCTQIPTAGVNQMIPPDEKEEQKLRSTKYETTFTLLHRLLRYEGAYGRLGTSDGRELSHSGAVGFGACNDTKVAFFRPYKASDFGERKHICEDGDQDLKKRVVVERLSGQ
jgi:hypothetical protein